MITKMKNDLKWKLILKIICFYGWNYKSKTTQNSKYLWKISKFYLFAHGQMNFSQFVSPNDS